MADCIADGLLHHPEEVGRDGVVMDEHVAVAPEQTRHVEHVAHLTGELFQRGGEAVGLKRHGLEAAGEVAGLGDGAVDHAANLLRTRRLGRRTGN